MSKENPLWGAPRIHGDCARPDVWLIARNGDVSSGTPSRAAPTVSRTSRAFDPRMTTTRQVIRTAVCLGRSSGGLYTPWSLSIELFGVADNNGYGLKVFAFLKLTGVPSRHARHGHGAARAM